MIDFCLIITVINGSKNISCIVCNTVCKELLKSELSSFMLSVCIPNAIRAIASKVARFISVKKLIAVFPSAFDRSFSDNESIISLKWPTNSIRTLFVLIQNK